MPSRFSGSAIGRCLDAGQWPSRLPSLSCASLLRPQPSHFPPLRQGLHRVLFFFVLFLSFDRPPKVAAGLSATSFFFCFVLFFVFFLDLASFTRTLLLFPFPCRGRSSTASSLPSFTEFQYGHFLVGSGLIRQSFLLGFINSLFLTEPPPIRFFDVYRLVLFFLASSCWQ